MTEMIASLKELDLSTTSWIVAFICAACIGMSKTGVTGIGILVIPVMAALFGGRMSTGIILPMLISADMFAIFYYRRHAEWKYIFRVLPWAVAGILLGLFIGKSVDDQLFKKMIAITVILSLGVNLWNDLFNKNKSIPHKWWFSAVFGLAGGFSTMIGNAAGPVMSVYLISMDMPKTVFVGTGAWFFAIINLFKLPLQIWGWHNIHIQGLLFNLVMLPAIALGAFLGILFLKKVPEKFYRIFVLATTAVGAFYLLR